MSIYQKTLALCHSGVNRDVVVFVGFRKSRHLSLTHEMSVGVAEDLEKVRELEMFRETDRDSGGGGGVWAVIANVMDLDSLCCAFDGCAAVFHTSSFIDPSGVSGYSVRPYFQFTFCIFLTYLCLNYEVILVK